MKYFTFVLFVFVVFSIDAQSSIQDFYDSVPGLEKETEKRFSADIKPTKILYLENASKFNYKLDGISFDQDGFAFVYDDVNRNRVYMQRTRRVREWADPDDYENFTWKQEDYLSVWCGGGHCNKWVNGNHSELSYTPKEEVEEETPAPEAIPKFTLSVVDLDPGKLSELSTFLDDLGVPFVIKQN